MKEAPLSRREVLGLFLLRTPKREAELDPAEAPPRSPPVERTVLRPPGAIEEERFLAACTSCHDCVAACPFEAIAIAADKMPLLVPDAMPCVSCLAVPCSHACASGALLPVEHPRDIRMGTARVDPDACVAFAGQLCQACFEACPFPHAAIRLEGSEPRPVVSPTLCTGCGVCAYVCPESAIAIVPASMVAGVAS